MFSFVKTIVLVISLSSIPRLGDTQFMMANAAFLYFV
jgi:hypothetical protein